MYNVYQNTTKNIVTFKGVGLHSGKTSTVRLIPGKENQGILFKRIDLKKHNIIKADYKNVTSATLCSTLSNDSGTKVSTVEHLLAALYLTKINNITIEIDNEEVPILDGSSKDFINILDEAKTIKQNKKIKYLQVLNKFEYEDKSRKISLEPSEFFEVEFELDYDNELIGKQKNKINFSSDNFQNIVESRTFCLFEDIKKIKNNGYAKGGSLDNAIVVDENKILNEGGLRNKKEFVNHKILDLVGDFALSGFNILGSVKCFKGGHELSNLFLRELLEKNKQNFKIIEKEDKEIDRVSQKGYFTRIAVNA